MDREIKLEMQEFEANARKQSKCPKCGIYVYIEETDFCDCGYDFRLKWQWYSALLRHDNGEFTIKTFARDKESAKSMIMEVENCPESAIISIVEVEC